MKSGISQSRRRVPLALLLAGLLLSVAATGALAASWADEAVMVSTPNRDTFIYAPAQGTYLDRGDLLAEGAYYDGHGFDENFIRWAPEDGISVFTAADWASCLREPSHSGTCPPGLFNGFHPVEDALGGGTIRTIVWRGAYIALACGNFTQGGADAPKPTVSGVKYEDLDADGQRDAGEPGLSGWTMRLLFEGREVASTTTAGDGSYAFVLDAIRLEIGAGTYRVVEDQQTGWIGAEAPGSFTVSHGVGDRVYGGNDFGNYRPAVISGRKVDDGNVDGLLEATELGLDGWTIQLSTGDEQTTASGGAYSFTVRPGTYTLQELLRTGWRQTAPGGDGTRRYTVISGQVVSDADFGNVCLGDVEVQPVDTSTGLPVTGMEIRIEEVSVPGILANDPALPRTTTGTPSFGDLLPGTYRIVAFLPDGVFTTDPHAVVVERRFAIVKQVTVRACGTTSVPLGVFTASTPGKVTGGMLKLLVPGGFATSGFEFMAKRDGPRGTLQYRDHAIGMNLHTSTIEAIHVARPVAFVWGRVTVGGVSQRFRLRLVDAGEPGTADRFELTLATGYTAGFGGPLTGGNVQIHS